MRNIAWRVSDKNTEQVTIGLTTLESIGCNNQTMVEAICDDYGGVFDDENADQSDNTKKARTISISSMMQTTAVLVISRTMAWKWTIYLFRWKLKRKS